MELSPLAAETGGTRLGGRHWGDTLLSIRGAHKTWDFLDLEALELASLRQGTCSAERIE